jgi:hypothetical protein
MNRPLLAILSVLAAAAAPALAGQPAPGGVPTTAADPDATCVVGMGMVIAGPGSDPSFMGTEHAAAVDTMHQALAFFGGRVTQRHEGVALERAILDAYRAMPRNRWLGEGARCMDEFAAAGPTLGQELERALEAVGIPRDRPEPRTPADAASLDPDLACIAVIVQMQRRVAQMGSAAPAGATHMLANGRAFFVARAMARLPQETRGGQLATTLRSVRDDQAELVYNQCRGRLTAEMNRLGRASRAAGTQDEPAVPGR